ncbi:hypothetical protein [Rahnella laticis]|uniref:hypothetical protein n=1 Tax=Rahnella laticis TaxID=2787622 RepID=UPI0018A27758|nr:hypothetical protein [Rahnella laticis]MBF7994832.1 hypothetical protein [Rahnella laticis]
MQIIFQANDKLVELDPYLDQGEMGVSDFQFSLEELSQYITGRIEMRFDLNRKISLDLFYDFAVCYEEIVESVINVNNGFSNKKSIWFCEQGSDFYINYEIEGKNLLLEYKKGGCVGFPNNIIEDFTVSIDRGVYVSEWVNLFSSIVKLFEIKLNKKINFPLDH